MTQPVLVLHSDDDPIVPAYLGQRLVDRTKEAGDHDEDDDINEDNSQMFDGQARRMSS